MGKQKEGGPPATWESETTLIYCNCCIKEIELGNISNTHFSKEGWENLTKNFNEQTGRSYDKTQIKNKWDQLKKEWTKKLQAIPTSKKFRYSRITPDLEEKLEIMFGRIIATGNDVWVPNSGVLPPEFHQKYEHCSDSFEYGASQRFKINGQSMKRKRKTKKKIPTGQQLFINRIEDLVNAARSISSAIAIANTPNISFTIKEVLEKICGISTIVDDSDFFYFATLLMREKINRETFMSLPDDRKVWWLRRRFLESST